jgi:thiamine kinase-like enzyme
VRHNDIAPYNIVYRDARVVGIIDLDLASPADPTWDLAFAAYAFAPIHTPDSCPLRPTFPNASACSATPTDFKIGGACSN